MKNTKNSTAAKKNIAPAAAPAAEAPVKSMGEIVGQNLLDMVRKDPAQFIKSADKTEWKFTADLGKGVMDYRMSLGEEMAKSGRRCHKQALYYTKDGVEKMFQFGNPWKKKFLYATTYTLTHPAKVRGRKKSAVEALNESMEATSEAI